MISPPFGSVLALRYVYLTAVFLSLNTAVSSKLFRGRNAFPHHLVGDVIDPNYLEYLSSDELNGRRTGTEGNAMAREYIIDILQNVLGIAGLRADRSGRDSYKQDFTTYDKRNGVDLNVTNVLGYIPGTEFPDEYIIVGAHFDGQEKGGNCPRNVFSEIGLSDNLQEAYASNPNVCNSAYDNASSITILLGIARQLTINAPRRTVVFAFWDGEEQGLHGSRYFVNNETLVSLESIITYVNFDNMGIDLLPSLKDWTFIFGAETGGNDLKDIVNDAIFGEGLQVKTTSYTFAGEDNSDHEAFYDKQIPVLFHSDLLNGCYHSTADEFNNINLEKLEKEARIGLRVVENLSSASCNLPSWEEQCLLELVWGVGIMNDMANLAAHDLVHFPEEVHEELLGYQQVINEAYCLGPISLLVTNRTRLEDAIGGFLRDAMGRSYCNVDPS